MKRKTRNLIILASVLIGIIITGLIMFVPQSYTVPIVPEIQDENYRIMTYNLRYSSSDYNEWLERREKIIDLIINYQPDSIGMQEADWDWMYFLPNALENYSYVGVGRDDGETQGEYAPIFYLTEKFNLLGNGTFWLSETPDEPSIGWDASTYRICTYAVLENNETSEIFVHLNTHFDHKGSEARQQSAEQILKFIADLDYPVVLTGDLNVYEGFKTYDILEKSSELGDSKYLAVHTMKWGTLNYFTNIHLRFMPPIDYIFVSFHEIAVNRYEVLYQHRYNDTPLSDHYPIFVDFALLELVTH